MLFRRFRQRKQRRFGKQLRRALKVGLRRGIITPGQYEQAYDHAGDPDIMAEVMDRVSNGKLRGGPVIDFMGNIDWDAVYKWITENLIPLLEVLFSVAILFLDEGPEE